MRAKLRRLEAEVRGTLDHIELADGSRHWYDRAETAKELFLYSCDCARTGRVADRPEPPEILRAVAGARDRRAALERVSPESPMSFFTFERGPLVERGELVQRSFVAGRDADDSAVEDLSER